MGLLDDEPCFGPGWPSLCQVLLGCTRKMCQVGVRLRACFQKPGSRTLGKTGLELWELNHAALGFSREAPGQDPGSGKTQEVLVFKNNPGRGGFYSFTVKVF